MAPAVFFTKYAKQTRLNSWERSEAILPLKEDEVREWAMNNLDDDGYRDICHKIEDKPVPVIKEKRPYTRSECAVGPKKVEAVINIIKENPSVSQTDFQKVTDLSRMQVVTILNHLKDTGKLEHTGSRRSGQWVLK